MKHGLFTEQIEFFLDSEESRQALLDLKRNLTLEFAPQTEWERIEVDLLATTLQQLKHYQGLRAAASGPFRSEGRRLDPQLAERITEAMALCSAVEQACEAGEPSLAPEVAGRLAWLAAETGFNAAAGEPSVDPKRPEAWAWPGPDAPRPRLAELSRAAQALRSHAEAHLQERKRLAAVYQSDSRAHLTEALDALSQLDVIERQCTRAERRIERLLKRMPRNGVLPTAAPPALHWKGAL